MQYKHLQVQEEDMLKMMLIDHILWGILQWNQDIQKMQEVEFY